MAFIVLLSLYRLATGDHQAVPPPQPVLDRLEEGVVRGSLAFADGTPFPYTLDRDSLAFTARTSHPELPRVRFEYEILEGGRFAARPRVSIGKELNLDQLEDFCVRFQPESIWHHVELQSLPTRQSAMARAESLEALATPEHDLGELRIGSVPPLMQISVVDVDGLPVEGARVFIEYYIPGRTLPGEWRRVLGVDPQRTDQTGRVDLVARDWADYFNYRPFGRGFPDAEFRSIRVRLNHPDHAPVYTELSTDQFEHQVRMPAAGVLICGIESEAVAEDLRIGVVRPGEAPHSTAWGLFSRRLRPSVSYYEVRSMLAGEVDVVITSQIGDRELLRIPNVQIPANEHTSDPRLMEIDLERDLGWVELSISWPDGRLASTEELEEWSPKYRYRMRGGIVSVDCSIVDGVVRIPVAKSGALQGWLELEGMQSVLLQDEPAGRKSVVARHPLVLEWRFEGADQIARRLDWSMQLVAPTKLAAIRQVGPYPDGRWTAVLPEPGEYRLEWVASLEGDARRHVQMQTKLAWSAEDLIEGKVHTIQVPEAFIEHIRQTFESE